MAGIVLNDPEALADENPEGRAFRELLARVYGQKPDDCYFRAQEDQRRWIVRKLSRKQLPPLLTWVDKFEAAPGQPAPKNSKDTLHAELPLAPPKRVKNLVITKNKVESDFKSLPDASSKIMQAFAMALAAKANKHMREKGVSLVGSDEEKLFLLIAVTALGLKVANVNPQLQQAADEYLQGKPLGQGGPKVEDLWQEFHGALATPKQAGAPPPAPVPPGPVPPAPPSGGLDPELTTRLREHLSKTKFKGKTDDKALEQLWAAQNDAGKNSILKALGLDQKIGLDGKAKTPPPRPESASPPPSNLHPELLAALHTHRSRTPELQALKTDAQLELFWNSTNDTDKKSLLSEYHLENKVGLDGKAISASTSAPPPPGGLRSIFNEAVPDHIKIELSSMGIAEDRYKSFRDEVIRKQEASRSGLKTIFKGRFSEDEQNIMVRMMDKEGVTSPQARPGQPRSVNFNADGTPRAEPKNP